MSVSLSWSCGAWRLVALVVWSLIFVACLLVCCVEIHPSSSSTFIVATIWIFFPRICEYIVVVVSHWKYSLFPLPFSSCCRSSRLVVEVWARNTGWLVCLQRRKLLACPSLFLSLSLQCWIDSFFFVKECSSSRRFRCDERSAYFKWANEKRKKKKLNFFIIQVLGKRNLRNCPYNFVRRNFYPISSSHHLTLCNLRQKSIQFLCAAAGFNLLKLLGQEWLVRVRGSCFLPHFVFKARARKFGAFAWNASEQGSGAEAVSVPAHASCERFRFRLPLKTASSADFKAI